MSVKRVAVLVWKNSKFFASAGGFVFPLAGVLYSLIHALIARFTSENTGTLFLQYAHFYIPFIITPISVWACLALIVEERIKRTGEMLFATPITTLEYLVSLWTVGFLVTTLVAYIGIIIFVIINGFVFLSGFPNLFWLSPSIMALTWTSAGVLLGLIWVKPGRIKKTLFGVIAFAPVITLFIWVKMEQVPQFLLWIPEIPPSLTSWLMTSLWLFLLLWLLGRKFEVRGLVC